MDVLFLKLILSNILFYAITLYFVQSYRPKSVTSSQSPEQNRADFLTKACARAQFEVNRLAVCGW